MYETDHEMQIYMPTITKEQYDAREFGIRQIKKNDDDNIMKKIHKKMTRKIKVDIHKDKNKVFTLYVKDRKDMHDKVLNTLYENGIEEEKATDCAKWCELAADGESYMEEDFDVYAESIM